MINYENQYKNEMAKIKYFGHKSLKRYLFMNYKKNGSIVDPMKLAVLGDTFIKESQQWATVVIAKQLGLIVKRRNEISDWKSRRVPKIRIGKYTYYLVKDVNKLSTVIV